MSPDEIMRLPRDFVLTFVESDRAFLLRKWHYYADRYLSERSHTPLLRHGISF